MKTIKTYESFNHRRYSNQVYTYGQKDYRGGKSDRGYVRYESGEFHEVDPAEIG